VGSSALLHAKPKIRRERSCQDGRQGTYVLALGARQALARLCNVKLAPSSSKDSIALIDTVFAPGSLGELDQAGEAVRLRSGG